MGWPKAASEDAGRARGRYFDAALALPADDAGAPGKLSGPFCPQADNPAASSAQQAASVIATLVGNFIRRILSTMAAAASPLSDSEFLRLADQVLAGIEATLDTWLQQDVIDIDASRTGGLLELSFPNGSKIVINTQPPLHELWVAARAGGHHYRHVQGRWLDTRDDGEFFEALSGFASQQGGKPLRFAPN